MVGVFLFYGEIKSEKWVEKWSKLVDFGRFLMVSERFWSAIWCTEIQNGDGGV